LGTNNFFVGHALIHVVDIISGYLPPSHWLIDAPSVFVPAILRVILSFPGMRMPQVPSK
jgi:hypothetical protein